VKRGFDRGTQRGIEAWITGAGGRWRRRRRLLRRGCGRCIGGRCIGCRGRYRSRRRGRRRAWRSGGPRWCGMVYRHGRMHRGLRQRMRDRRSSGFGGRRIGLFRRECGRRRERQQRDGRRRRWRLMRNQRKCAAEQQSFYEQRKRASAKEPQTRVRGPVGRHGARYGYGRHVNSLPVGRPARSA